MKILLLQPPIRDFYETRLRQFPLGLCYLKAALEHFIPNVRAKVVDLRHGTGSRPAALPPELSYLSEYYGRPDSSPFCTFSSFRHFGASLEQTMTLARREKPDLVGISCLFSPYCQEALETARAVKQACGCPVVLGGGHASAAPLSLLESPHVDFVVQGEGERPLVDLVQALEAGKNLACVSSLVFRGPQGPVFTPKAPNHPFESLPLPDVSDLPLNAYRLGKKPLCFVQASRGCPMGCTFCTVSSIFGRKWRKRPVPHVMEEIRLRAAQGYRAVDFEDDNLNLDREYFQSLLHALAREFENSDMSFCAMNGLSPLGLDPATAALMKRAGFDSLNLSLVSSNEHTQQEAGRPFPTQDFEEAARNAFAQGMRVTAYQIIGMPGESLDAMMDTLALLAQLPVLAGLSIFYLAPGCPLAPDNLGSADFVRARSTALGPDPEMRQALYTLFICGRIINFIKGLPVTRSGQCLADVLDQAASLGPRTREGVGLLQDLLNGKGLAALTPEGPRDLPLFDAGLFFSLLERIPFVATQAGQAIAAPHP